MEDEEKQLRESRALRFENRVKSKEKKKAVRGLKGAVILNMNLSEEDSGSPTADDSLKKSIIIRTLWEILNDAPTSLFRMTANI